MLRMIAAALVLSGPALTLAMETKPEHDARMKWWKEARFGLFIHWGVYSVPAGAYGGKTGYGEWIMESAHVPLTQYEQWRDQFNPTKFNAADWVKLAKGAGMKYLVITTKHHDGFAMFDSKTSDWDIMSTPFKHDVMKDIADACRKEGIVPCWYHSIMDWHHPDYTPHRAWSTTPPPDANFDRYEKYLHDEVTELLTNYGKIGLMWFDGEWESTWTSERGQRLLELCRKLQPGIIVNNRVGRARYADSVNAGMLGDYGTPEQEIPATGLPGVDWETCMTMNSNWGYNAADKDFKSTKELVQNLVDIVSKGGNYLLNVGPKSDGTIPEESVNRLKEIGQWMKVNGQAIYGTEASPFSKLPWGRATQKKGTIYLQVFDWPTNGRLPLHQLGNELISARVLGGPAVQWEGAGANLDLLIPRQEPNSICSVIELKFKGAPIVFAPPVIENEGDEFVGTAQVSFAAPSPGIEMRYAWSPLSQGNFGTQIPYKGPFTVNESGAVSVSAYFKGTRVGDTVYRTFKKVQPWPGEPLPPQPQITRRVWNGEFEKCGEWDGHLSDVVAGLPDFSLGQLGSQENVAAVMEGQVEIKEDTMTSWQLTSDDGSRLWIDGQLVVDNDGLHSSLSKKGFAPLGRGFHRVKVEWFNRTGSADLDIRYKSDVGEWAKL